MRVFWTLLFLFVPVLGVGLILYSMATPNAWLPENVSTNGKDVDYLFYVILAITGFFFVVTEILLVYAILTAKSEGKSHYTHGSKALEVSWTVMTAGILLFIALYQMPAWAKAKFLNKFKEEHPDAKPIALVTASQFLWQVRYPTVDANGQVRELNWKSPNFNESFEVINELHVPPNEMVMLQLTTRDVIHSFWIPAMRVKQDALPGNVIPVWFDATKPGTYEWVCAELCGWGHFRMRAKVVVHESRPSYENWLKEQTAKQFPAK